MAQGNLVQALKTYRDGLAVADDLAKSDPASVGWQHDVTISYMKVGDVLEAGGNHTEALKAYQDSLAIRDRLAKADSNNANHQRGLAIIQGRVGLVLAEKGDVSGARSTCFDRGASSSRGSRNNQPMTNSCLRTSAYSMTVSRSWSKKASLRPAPRSG